jgi:spermidine synthase
VLPPAPLFRDRSFFGVTEVLRTDTETILMHGTTVHGRQPVGGGHTTDPGSYYAEAGPIGDMFRAVDRHPANRIVVVGLGAGAITSYARSTDDIIFYEIDPLVVRVATDRSLFTYLANHRPPATIRIGDGRLLLAATPDASVDVLILDAFSSDAPATHLLTSEAIHDAMRTLDDDGVLTVHVSNRYYGLSTPVAAALRAAGADALGKAFAPTAEERANGASPSVWVVGTRDSQTRDALVRAGWTALPQDEPLTDDFPDLLRWFGRD